MPSEEDTCKTLLCVNEIHLAFFCAMRDVLEKQKYDNENCIFMLLYKQC